MGAISKESIEAAIVAEYFIPGHQICPDGPIHPSVSTLTICVLVLKNGFTVVGESNCVYPEDFDAEIGRNVARARAINKVWELEGYAARGAIYRLDRELSAMEKQQG